MSYRRQVLLSTSSAKVSDSHLRLATMSCKAPKQMQFPTVSVRTHVVRDYSSPVGGKLSKASFAKNDKTALSVLLKQTTRG